MTRWRLMLGFVVATAVGAVVVLACRRLRRRLVPGWWGLEALLADVVLVVSFLTVVADVAGMVGLFSPWPMAVGLTVASGVAWRLARGPGRDEPSAGAGHEVDPDDPDASMSLQEPGWVKWLVAAGVGAVAVAWFRGLPAVYHHGIYEWDSVWYHLPVAADFVQTRSFLGLHLYGADAAVSTYPFGSEVFHALGMLVAGSDVLSPLLNFVWAGVFVLAAHVFGRRFGCPHSVTLAALVVLAAPIVIALEASTALSESMGLAFLMAALAFTVFPEDRPDRRGRLILAGLAIGLVASTKFTMLGPSLVVFVSVLVIEGHRVPKSWRSALMPLAVSTSLTSVFWYGRNVWLFKNPLPEFSFSLGPLHLGHVEIGGTNGPMLPTLVTGIRSGALTGQITQSLGPIWYVLLLLPVIALVVSGFRRRVELMVLAVGSAVVFFMGLMTPQYTKNGFYRNIWSNTRYLLPGIAIAVVVSAASMSSSKRMARLSVAFLTGILLLTFLEAQTFPRNSAASLALVHSWWYWSVLAAVATVIGVFIHGRSGRGKFLVRRMAGVLVPSVGALVLILVLPSYLSDRFQTFDASYSYFPSRADEVFSWAQERHGRRIAIEPYSFADFIDSDRRGFTHVQNALLFSYGLYGRDLSNRVEPIARFDGTRVIRPTSCLDWWDDLRRFDATNVLLWEPGGGRPRPSGQTWTERSPATREVLRAPMGSPPHAWLVLYEVDPAVTPRCG